MSEQYEVSTWAEAEVTPGPGREQEPEQPEQDEATEPETEETK